MRRWMLVSTGLIVALIVGVMIWSSLSRDAGESPIEPGSTAAPRSDEPELALTPPGETPAVRTPDADAEADPESPNEPSGAIEPGATIGEYLSNYWGPHWPSIEAEARAMGNGGLLDHAPTEMPVPWEEVESRLEELLAEEIDRERVRLPFRLGAGRGSGWPESLTVDYLARGARLGLTRDELDESVVERAAVASTAIRWDVDRAERALVGMYHAECLRLLRSKSYGKCSFLYIKSVERAMMAPEDWDRPRWSPTVVKDGGWVVVFHLFKDEHPEIQRLAKELRELYAERNRVVLNAVRG